ncbi:hypothetical protein [Actinomyces sp.]|uniref:hypothetical protein n=1 Tax=Actinomyces sp. TaxID=29317 RepID=UPI0026DDAF13|nr:hypothetical protein [Actinomyces sp.]MDO4900768.1 hypothetical protein [Actinomyces sp.]
MATGRLRTDTAPLQPLIPVLRGDEPSKWVICDDSDDGLPGLVSTWIHALVTVDLVFAKELASYTDTFVRLPTDLPVILGVDRALAWRTGSSLVGGLGISMSPTFAALAGRTLYVRRFVTR